MEKIIVGNEEEEEIMEFPRDLSGLTTVNELERQQSSLIQPIRPQESPKKPKTEPPKQGFVPIQKKPD